MFQRAPSADTDKTEETKAPRRKFRKTSPKGNWKEVIGRSKEQSLQNRM